MENLKTNVGFNRQLKKWLFKMKLTLTIFLFCLTGVFASTYSQVTRLDINLKNGNMIELIKQIESKSEFFFYYQKHELGDLENLTVKAKNATVMEVLNKALKGTSFDYSIIDRYIVVRKVGDTFGNDFLKTAAENIATQQRSVSGKVTDSGGQPLPGVTVVVKGTTQGTVTNADGNYTLTNIPEDASLVFSFVGMRTQEIVIGERASFSVVMEEETFGIEEVVAIGYGTVLKKDMTTSVSKVNVTDVPKSAASNLTQTLLGRAAGVQSLISSSEPGGGINISIRGSGTPIYVVDGVVLASNSLEPETGTQMTHFPSTVNRAGLAGLNPEDVESVEILKDASASIYGIDASRGVVLITTKKGKTGPIKVNYTGSMSYVTNYEFPELCNAQEYMTFVNLFNFERHLYNEKYYPYGATSYEEGWSPIFNENEINSAQTTDWPSYALRDGAISKHNIVLSGGQGIINYYISGNYHYQKGTVYNSSMDRYTLRSNISADLTSFLKLTTVINANNNYHDNSNVGTNQGVGTQGAGALQHAVRLPPQLPMKDEFGNYNIFQNFANPVALREMSDKTKMGGLYMNFAADLTIIKNLLNAKLLYGNNQEKSHRDTYIPSYIYFDQMYRSRGNLGISEREYQTFEGVLSFNKKFAEILDFDAVIGAGKYLRDYNGMSVGYNGQYDAIANDNLATISGQIAPQSYRSEDEKRSQFLRLNFSFLDRYIINSTIRRDGTDKFFPGQKYSIFPAISAAWKIYEEPFMRDIEWIDLLKVRGSYGVTGNDNLGTSLYGTYGPFPYKIAFNENAIMYSTIYLMGLDYPDVTWEKTIMKNLGLDFYFFNNRLSGSFDLFRNEITNMLGTANASELSMFSSYPINGGHIRKEGFDASLNTVNIKTQNFLWNSLLNLSRVNSFWVERFPNYDYRDYELRENIPTAIRYYYETEGIINIDKSNMPSSQPYEAQLPGYPIIKDQNKDGEITIDDIVTDNNIPDIYIGFGNNFQYKNFDLEIFAYSQLGVTKYNNIGASAGNFASEGINQSRNVYKIWNSQNNLDGTWPGIAYGLASVSLPGGVGTNLMQEDASFIRIRNITLGYKFTANMLGFLKGYINNLRVYLDAQNPFLFTNYGGYDPEINLGGTGTGIEYPNTRTFSFGVDLNF